MSTITPLGDTQYFDLGFTSLNNWGVEIDYVSDIWGGAVPNHIPNPRGSTATTEQLGCCLDAPVFNPQPEPIPEPGYALMMVFAILAMRWRKTFTTMTKHSRSSNYRRKLIHAERARLKRWKREIKRRRGL